MQRVWQLVQQAFRSMVWILLVGLNLWITACSGGSEDTPGTIPIPISTLTPPPTSDGTVAIPMPIRTFLLGSSTLKLLDLPTSVGGSSADLILDTGSSGIRILTSAAGSNVTRTGIADNVQFADGTVFVGELAFAPVLVGSVPTEEEIIVQLIDEVTCAATVPNCPGDRVFSASGFAGIIGVSLADRTNNDLLFSPVTRFPGNLDSGYIIQTGGFNSTQGFFSVGLTSTNQAGFTSVSLPRASSGVFGGAASFEDGTPIWIDSDLQPQYTISVPNVQTGIQGAAASTLFDCGTSDIVNASGSLGSFFSASPLPVGSAWTAQLPDVFSYPIQVTNPITPGDNRIFVETGSGLQLIGMPFFLDLDVLFDIDNGRIGFRLPG